MSQHKILTKLNTPYPLIQPCQVNYIFILNLFYYNIKEKDPIRRKINDKKVIYMWNQYYFHLPKINVGRARTTKM